MADKNRLHVPTIIFTLFCECFYYKFKVSMFLGSLLYADDIV